MKTLRKLSLFALAGVLASVPALAAYPEKPIKLVIPYKAGGGSDSLARQIQAVVEKYKLMPQPMVVVNTAGAGGVVGARAVKGAKPDGYTFLQMHNELLALSATGRLGFDPRTDFEPVAQTTQSCLYLAVPANSPYKTFEALVEGAKQAPGKLKLADIIGGISHFSAVELMQKLDFSVGVVQTGGTSARFASMKGGHTDMAFMSPGWIVRGGDELRGLLWVGPERPPQAKMPMASERDLDVTACLNRRFWAPAGTPADRVAFFAEVLSKAMQTEELKAYHQKRLSDIVIRTGDELKQDVAAEAARFDQSAEIVRKSMK